MPGYGPRNVGGGGRDGELGLDMYAAFGKEDVRDKARGSFVERFRKRNGEDGTVREEDAFI